MKNLDLYVKLFEILIMFIIEVQIIKYFLSERKRNISDFNKINNHKSIGKERAFKKIRGN